MEIYKPNEFAKKIGVTVLTLQRWDNSGVLKANRTPTNRRCYTDEHLQKYHGLSPNSKYVVELCDKCGNGYILKNIDFEQCIYKDFGNGYDIEISLVSKRGMLASIYVWYKDVDGRYSVIKTIHEIHHNDLPIVVKELERRYSNE